MQNYTYPSSSDVTVTGIGTPNNQPIGTTSVLVAGENPSGNQTVIQTDPNGNLITTPASGSQQHVIVDSSALPTGASTSALQTSGNSSLSTIATNTTGVATAANQTTGNNSLATIATNTTGVSTAANQVTGNNSLATIATNSGTQATAANQTTGNTTLTTIATNISNTTGTKAAGTAAVSSELIGAVFNTTLPTLTTGQQAALQADSSGRLLISSTTLATSANQTNGSQVTTLLGLGGTAVGSNNNGLNVVTQGLQAVSLPFSQQYGTTPITTSTYTQIYAAASITTGVQQLDIFDSSGQAMILATGAAGSEVAKYYIPPGGATVKLQIPATTRIAIRALTANATSGYLLVSLLG